MAFTIPNETVALANKHQAEVDSIDLGILVTGYNGTGVISGCAVTAQGTPDMTVAVASGTVIVAGTRSTVTGANVTITAADGSNPRFDLIVSNSSGTLSTTAGTPAASPVFPAIPASSVVLAAVYVPASDTDIDSNQITDKRVIVGDLITTGLLNNAKLTFGTTPSSEIYYDGTDTFWDLQAAGSGGLMIALASGFPSPDTGVHVWLGDSTGAAGAGTTFTGERNTDLIGLQMLAPNGNSTEIRFGSSASNRRGRIRYHASTDTPADTFAFDMAAITRLLYSPGAFAFQEATTISVTAGDLTLAPPDGGQVVINPESTGTSNQIAIFNGSQKAGVNGDEAYLSFMLDDTLNISGEVARITWELNDAGNGTEDGEIRFALQVNSTLTTVMTLDEAMATFNNITRLDGRMLNGKGADVASADEMTLGIDGNYIDITGTTTINHIANTSWQAGSIIVLQFDASVTVTHNSGSPTGTEASILLAGASDFSATAGDTLVLIYDGTTFREIARTVI